MKIITVIPENTCPNCHAKVECQRGAYEEAVPKPGDISVCLRCQHILAFDNDMKLQNPTLEQIEEYKEDDKLWNQIQKLRWVIKGTI